MPSLRSRGLRILLGLAVLLVLAGGAATGFLYLTVLRDLPDFHTLADYRPQLTTRVLDREGRIIGEFFEQRRRLVGVEELPDHVVLAFVASEDDSFFEHSGLDYMAILRAAWVDLLAGEKKQGASTITMQTAKNLLLTPERAFRRKLKEMVLARRIEKRFSKDEILFLYLNEIYFGSGAYGIAEAARTYFDKGPEQLGVSEAALLAGLPKAPSRYSPFANPKAAERRRRYVLERMRDAAFLSPEGFEEALAEVPETAPPSQQDFQVAGYFTEQVRRALFDALGGEVVLRGGLVVHTTLDLELQRQAVAALRRGLEALDQRHGYRGHVARVEASALPEEILRLARKNDLPGAEPQAETVPPEDAEAAPAQVPTDRPLLGVVTDVDREAKVAWVAFAPGISASVRLEDVTWAGPAEPIEHPDPVKSIDALFGVGDVAHFVRAAADAESEEQGKSGETHVRLYQEPGVEGALISFDVASSEVLALVGGYDFERSEFDRAVQARRQPGSAFKPLIYATALSRGMTAASIVHDRPIVYKDSKSGFTWRPENYGRRFLGPLTLHEALARSVNNATIHVLKEVGVGPVAELARKLGIESPLERDLSLALGTSPVSLFELTRAYGAFAAGGERVVPIFVRRVEDRDGNVLFENLPLGDRDRARLALPRPTAGETPDEGGAAPPEKQAEPALSRAEAYLAVEMLRAVVRDPQGTGRRARSLGRPVAGKTGTTNDQGDAWFVGFSPDVVSGVWVGYDEKRVLGRGETGGRAALPIWIDFMRATHEGRRPREFPMPDGIVVARIDRSSGLLADANSQDAFFQAFLAGTEPTETASTALSTAEGRRRLRLEF